MRYRHLITGILAACTLLGAASLVQARRGIMDDWQTYYNVCQPLVTADCDACHQNGFDYNLYGEDMRIRIEDQGMSNIDAFIAIEDQDSDGDSFTNGQEIVVDCTFPWDASDQGTVPAAASTWGTIKVLFR